MKIIRLKKINFYGCLKKIKTIPVRLQGLKKRSDADAIQVIAFFLESLLELFSNIKE